MIFVSLKDLVSTTFSNLQYNPFIKVLRSSAIIYGIDSTLNQSGPQQQPQHVQQQQAQQHSARQSQQQVQQHVNPLNQQPNSQFAKQQKPPKQQRPAAIVPTSANDILQLKPRSNIVLPPPIMGRPFNFPPAPMVNLRAPTEHAAADIIVLDGADHVTASSSSGNGHHVQSRAAGPVASQAVANHNDDPLHASRSAAASASSAAQPAAGPGSANKAAAKTSPDAAQQVLTSPRHQLLPQTPQPLGQQAQQAKNTPSKSTITPANIKAKTEAQAELSPPKNIHGKHREAAVAALKLLTFFQLSEEQREMRREYQTQLMAFKRKLSHIAWGVDAELWDSDKWWCREIIFKAPYAPRILTELIFGLDFFFNVHHLLLFLQASGFKALRERPATAGSNSRFWQDIAQRFPNYDSAEWNLQRRMTEALDASDADTDANGADGNANGSHHNDKQCDPNSALEKTKSEGEATEQSSSGRGAPAVFVAGRTRSSINRSSSAMDEDQEEDEDQNEDEDQDEN